MRYEIIKRHVIMRVIKDMTACGSMEGEGEGISDGQK